jgi:hypothetical protein
MKYKLPLAVPKGEKPIITGPYGANDPELLAWYAEHGLNLTAHNGVDIVVGDSILTYGTRIVCPVPEAELSQTWWDYPMSTKGNGIQIAWEEGPDRYNMRAWHCSEIVTNRLSFKEGDVIGYIGNSGLVRPAPTPQRPFDGSHIHLMLYKNGVIIDPMTVFNIKDWFTQEDTGVEKDLPPLQWALKYAKEQFEKLKKLLGYK